MALASTKILINVKIVGGQGCTLEVQNDILISEIKICLESKLNVPVGLQKLLYRGKPLVDGKKLTDYNIGNGAMLYCMKTKESSAAGSSSESTNVLHSEMKKFLRRYFNEVESDKIADEYIKGFNRSICQLSLDDWQRVANTYLQAGGE